MQRDTAPGLRLQAGLSIHEPSVTAAAARTRAGVSAERQERMADII